MKSRWLMIRQLDKQLNEWQAINQKYSPPRGGWVKTLRTALNMSAAQLANRLGLTRARITQLENAEIHDGVTLRTLKEAANAMECELIYAIVPKNNSTLESILRTRAENIADEQVSRVAHSMSLEAQSVNADMLCGQKQEIINSLLSHLNKKFWSNLDNNKTKQNKLKKLIENLKKKK